MAELFVEGGPLAGQEFPIEGDLLLGRAPECDITIPSSFVSRNHARVALDGDRYFIEDLGTPNGTYVNGLKVKRVRLNDGDSIRVGDCELTFVVQERAVRGQEGPWPEAGQSTVVGTVDAERPPTSMPDEADTGMVVKLKAHLRVLQEVSQTACGTLVIAGLLDRILQQLLRVYPQADHVHGLLEGLADDGSDLRLSAARPGQGAMDFGMSRTLVRLATGGRKAILAGDVESDARLGEAESIVGRSLRSIMCSPLLVGDKVLGAIQVDTRAAGRPFTLDDLQLLVTVAGQVAVAAENARLHREVVAQQRLAAIGQTISSLAHCIKNVLNALQGGAYILDLGIRKEDRDKIGKGWEMVKRNNDFMFDLVKDMLAYCRKSGSRRQPTDIGALLNDTLLMVREAASQKGVQTSLSLEGNVPELQLDQTGVKRVVLNLLTNAVEACSEGCHVTVRADADEEAGRVRIVVEDDGPGMPAEVQERMFEPFFTTKGTRGTGLGLALVQKVVEEHRGRVQVESGPGKGTTFRIFIPTAPEQPDTALME